MSIDYNRQRDFNIPMSDISVVGVGGTGSWVALFSAMSGSPQIKLFDSDHLELHNFNRLPFPISAQGKLKRDAMKDLIRALRPTCSVYGFPNVEVESLSLLEGIVYDCTDRRAVQTMLQTHCEENNQPYRRVGYDGNHVTTLSQVGVIHMDDAQDGYTVFPSWVVPSALVACLGVYSVLQCNNKKSYMGSIVDMFSMDDPESVDTKDQRTSSDLEDLFG
jgi:hypothetical protein